MAGPRTFKLPLIFALILPLLAGLFLGIGFRSGHQPQLQLSSQLPAIARGTAVGFLAYEPHRGLAEVQVTLRQGQRAWPLWSKKFEVQPIWNPWGAKTSSAADAILLGVGLQEGLQEGDTEIEVTAVGAAAWFRPAQSARQVLRLPVRTRPPRLDPRTPDVAVTQGGSGVLVYRVGEGARRHGVEAGRWFFPGFPLPGGNGEFFALFAAPYDLDDPRRIVLVAEDELGNRGTLPFIERFVAKPVKRETLTLSDRFLETVVPKIVAATPGFKDRGGHLANYLAINGALRQANNERIFGLARRSEPRFWWTRAFVAQDAKVVSSFADRRTYVYQGREVDRQDHLGFDLASFQAAAIPAANDGVVVLAEYLGIYGNAIVIDHGYGLMTLYAHLSRIDVGVGERVSRSATIGRTGSTGMSFGDHLHFTTLIQGLPVNPLEWWDARWIRQNVANVLGTALPFEDQP